MLKKVMLLLICFFPNMLVIAQPAGSFTEKEKEVWRNAEALNRAIFENKDSTTLKRLLHEKVTYGHSSGAIEDKKLMIEKVISNTATYKNINLEMITVRLSGRTAVIRHNLRATANDKGISSPLDLSILQVWIKEKGKWQLLARQAVKIVPKG